MEIGRMETPARTQTDGLNHILDLDTTSSYQFERLFVFTNREHKINPEETYKFKLLVFYLHLQNMFIGMFEVYGLEDLSIFTEVVLLRRVRESTNELKAMAFLLERSLRFAWVNKMMQIQMELSDSEMIVQVLRSMSLVDPQIHQVNLVDQLWQNASFMWSQCMGWIEELKEEDKQHLRNIMEKVVDVRLGYTEDEINAGSLNEEMLGLGL